SAPSRACRRVYVADGPQALRSWYFKYRDLARSHLSRTQIGRVRQRMADTVPDEVLATEIHRRGSPDRP
ncbi:MAG: hypothetical protein WD990_09930, partial [Acidimicrobiia bacterium]